MAKKKEPEGVVIPVHDTKPLHNQLRSVAGMSQGLEVQIDGVPLKLRGLHIYSHKRGGEFGTLVLDFLTVKAKPRGKLPANWIGALDQKIKVKKSKPKKSKPKKGKTK